MSRARATFSGVLLLAVSLAALGTTPADIVANNTRAMVYIQVEDAQGQFIDSGSGFIVTHDGLVVTAAHVNAEPGQSIWGIVGQRDGTRFRLDRRDRDEANDVGLWQLPQSATCQYAATLSDKPLKVFDRLLAMGFPGKDGLTPSPISVSNLSDPETGFTKADGFLRGGFSGGPVFNEDGMVVALVHSGTPAGGNNVLVPISFATSLIKKRGAPIGVNTPLPFDNACYATCRAPAHGIESWTASKPWTAHNHEDGGGHNEPDECKSMIARDLVGTTDTQIELTGSRETSGQDWGHYYYDYYCEGTQRSGPVYVSKQSPACGLWR